MSAQNFEIDIFVISTILLNIIHSTLLRLRIFNNHCSFNTICISDKSGRKFCADFSSSKHARH